MLANFTKKEYHEVIMLYLLNVLDNRQHELLDESQPEWNEFIDTLELRQIRTLLMQKRVDLSMKTRTFGKSVVESLMEIGNEEPVKLMF